MKTLFSAAALAMVLFTGTAANALPTNDPCAPNTKLDYRFYKNNTKKNLFNLAYETQTDQPVTIKVINAEGQEVYSHRYNNKVLSTSVSLKKLAPGQYTLDIFQGAGCKINTETLTIE